MHSMWVSSKTSQILIECGKPFSFVDILQIRDKS